MVVYRTKSLSSWALRGRKVQVNGHDLTGGKEREIQFDMQLPYIYLPYSDWLQFSQKIAEFNLNIVCNYNENYCRFNQPCSEVQLNEWFFSFELFDNLVSNNYIFPSNNRFLIPGDVIGSLSNQCYLPVFQSGFKDDVVYLGNFMMNYLYMVFDMSPFDEHNQDYITVGVAPINPEDIIGQQ